MDNIYYLFSKYYHDSISHIEDTYIRQALEKKFIHTMRVVQNATEISIREKISYKDRLLVETAALFHDIGRFSQFIRYRTFSDKDTINHAELSSEIFVSFKDDLLCDLNETEIDMVKRAISEHNKLEISSDLDDKTLLVTQILRDADKLNIMEINLNSNFLSAMSFLSDECIINPKCIESFDDKKAVKNKDVYTVYDNKVKLLSWIYEFNYRSSLMMLSEKGIVDMILTSYDIENEDINNQLETMSKKVKLFIERELER